MSTKVALSIVKFRVSALPAAARGGAETLIKRDIRHGCAVVREGIAKGWLPTDRCISIAAFGNAPTAPRRLALYELALDEATRDGAPAALLEACARGFHPDCEATLEVIRAAHGEEALDDELCAVDDWMGGAPLHWAAFANSAE